LRWRTRNELVAIRELARIGGTEMIRDEPPIGIIFTDFVDLSYDEFMEVVND
jgi:hypothetical protein